MNYSFIIQARTLSTRLPNKILLPFYKNSTILDLQINSLVAHFPNSHIVLATTTNPADDELAEKYVSDKRLKVFRGDENNVLKRFIDAAKALNIEHIVRVCSDNPFLSMPYIKQLVEKYTQTLPDYTSYQFSDGTPSIKSHSGLFVEMVSLKTLEKVAKLTTEPLYMEHVTNYIYSYPASFKIEFIPVPGVLNKQKNNLRLTIDTKLDFENLQKLYLSILNKYKGEPTIEELVKEVENDKELVSSMQEQIKQHAK